MLDQAIALCCHLSVLADPGIGARGDDKPLQNWMIAVIAGVAGLLLLAIVVLCLCCFKRRKKARGGKEIISTCPSNSAQNQNRKKNTRGIARIFHRLSTTK